jgi:hypothetical protein
MRSAGKDGTKLFSKLDLTLNNIPKIILFNSLFFFSLVTTHAWVNYEFMLEKCFVGFLVGEQHNLLT